MKIKLSVWVYYNPLTGFGNHYGQKPALFTTAEKNVVPLRHKNAHFCMFIQLTRAAFRFEAAHLLESIRFLHFSSSA
jgi:hypothetical protein